MKLLEFEDALTRILAAIPPPIAESIPLTEADGRVLGQPIVSPIDSPPFDNSSMDGYALRSEDVATASPASPVRLRLCGRVAAGETFNGQLVPGECVRLFTGSPLPRDADAVVMQEDTSVEPDKPEEILILDGAKPWENVRMQGEDFKCGEVLIEKGQRLTPGRLSLMAACGVSQAIVGRRPVVGLLASGSELIEPGQALAPGQIYESNRVGVGSLMRRAGAIPKQFALVPDTLAATRQSLGDALEQCDAVVTSGGVSVGELDFIKEAFAELGGELQFWKVAIKPGRPFVFGRCENRFLFGLPGNPISALVTFVLLVAPALRRWQGEQAVSTPTHPGVLAEPLPNPSERRHFMRVKVDTQGKVYSAGMQASHVLSAMAAANGLVDVPPRTTLAAGQLVLVRRWD